MAEKVRGNRQKAKKLGTGADANPQARCPPLPTLPVSLQNRCMSLLPIMRPKLPSADRLAPYLRSIDASRLYSNFGPLALSFEDRLAEHYGLNEGTVATVANATLGLALALTVQQSPPGSLCAMPAWTFVASAHAAVMAGLVP